MRRLPVVFRPQARTDLADIFRTILHRSQDIVTARRFTQRIKDRCDRIGDAPHAGRPRDDLLEGLRTVSFERSAVITYRVERGAVRIFNVFYGGRDVAAFYGDGTGDEPRGPSS
ncbi:type II toxin-antitoxin system RelE/ParE family toxin [Methylobacterium sp. J-026]|uniref:type II toxin-antitoxin system RelE/ParE family toxin n=1 Tax=Methylobacterium sp. J-026 TaxID=2836624 RepID=UPI001FBB08C0|nr:type II toxin-antitoxin system RelE/ParE family toxin [Methylobacterium sp. J-026]MCJ2135522.1 type II toxin-antitoxin system RelE/ParE family toxin [Methylobacterium sp. J-026]